ncbi:MAG TPA: hypothetical protein VLG40_03360 [Candidatus Saccharimonas sp.]|nr:hypothetical protein [Candidatus Saccharimonas sp.]
MGRTFVGTSANYCEVYVDLEASRAATQLRENPGLLELIKEALPQIELVGPDVTKEHDFGKVIGFTDLVEVGDGDEIVYAVRENREVYTKFAKDREPSECNWVTMVFRAVADGYMLYTTWIGQISPPFPGEPTATHESWAFWRIHALVYGRQAIKPGTETTVCPDTTNPW